MEKLREKKGFICDMDGVIYHGNRLLGGVKEFVDYVGSKQICLVSGNKMAIFCGYSANKNFIL